MCVHIWVYSNSVVYECILYRDKVLSFFVH